ncbi:hypothetical protein PVL29_020963 [Vitis rotundifolia]|uniref:Uncharacterized protein n=1 Tax=Vitis rotundifolia TaxID=103349 RepID=A0AA38YY86_VITRO|nr:hypothetical protein PVL29_020963 [Vitis rotundifolia]
MRRPTTCKADSAYLFAGCDARIHAALKRRLACVMQVIEGHRMRLACSCDVGSFKAWTAAVLPVMEESMRVAVK